MNTHTHTSVSGSFHTAADKLRLGSLVLQIKVKVKCFRLELMTCVCYLTHSLCLQRSQMCVSILDLKETAA